MQTRSNSASSVATGTTKKQYTAEETDIIMQKMNEKERQLKEQAEVLQAKHDQLTRMQEEINRRARWSSRIVRHGAIIDFNAYDS